MQLSKKDEPIEIVEIDKIHSYAQHKKTTVGAGRSQRIGISTGFAAITEKLFGSDFR